MEYLSNPDLETIRPDWPGNPFAKDQFHYPRELFPSFEPSWQKLLQWQLGSNPQRNQKKADQWRPTIHDDNGHLRSSGDFLCWLGHATFLLQLDGIRMITDPVLYNLPFLERFVKLPYAASELKDIDYILLSHDHRDHCDKKSLATILAANRPRKILTALRMSNVIGSWVNGTPVEEASWYQRYATAGDHPEVLYLPARHWCRRGLFDFNRVLWGSFLIRHHDRTIYFGADSGYGDHFAAIGRQFPDIDLAIIGIGAYKPDYIMQEIHTSPAEALQAFRDLGARRLLPMHYGTYDLSDEPISEPYREIQRLFVEAGLAERLILPAVNEPVWLKDLDQRNQ